MFSVPPFPGSIALAEVAESKGGTTEFSRKELHHYSVQPITRFLLC